MTNVPNERNTTAAPPFLACPWWCETNHFEQDRKLAADVERIIARTGEVPEWMARWHTRTVATIPNPHAGQDVEVTLFRDDSLVEPEPNRVVVNAQYADCMSPAVAMEVSIAIAETVRLLAQGGEPR